MYSALKTCNTAKTTLWVISGLRPEYVGYGSVVQILPAAAGSKHFLLPIWMRRTPGRGERALNNLVLCLETRKPAAAIVGITRCN